MVAFVLLASSLGLDWGETPANTDVIKSSSSVASVPENVPFPTREELTRSLLLNNADARYEAKLWLARCIFSESSRPNEQRLVAWVVRNRVETTYRGKSTYRRVVLDPYQFSAFNPDSPHRSFLMALDSTDHEASWVSAMQVAEEVLIADPSLRPFPVTTRHFYSERSLGHYDHPVWALEADPIPLDDHGVEEKRFRFFDGVS